MSTPTPEDVDDATLAFPARVVGSLLPARSSIPKGFALNKGSSWVSLAERWFFKGMPGETEIATKEGIDIRKAVRHLSACLGSFEPKHEHKIEGVAYLMSLWFDCVRIPSTGEEWKSA